ncbi:DUF808 family protein [Janibacter hoylei]|uniref:DUF808 family protein n=1 Tax=Janibacter hoylei TaxID=364298 RepID=UPI003899F797
MTTDFILSAEIMVISLKAVLDEGLNDSFWYLLAVMIVVAVVITLVVYGTVALIVKMDDIGLALAKRESGLSQTIGQGLVSGMPKLLSVLSVVGVAAMLWVGGHIILVGLEETGWLLQPYEFVHHLEELVHGATGALGGVLGWLTNTAASAILGLLVGAVVVAVMHVLPFGKDEGEAQRPTEAAPFAEVGSDGPDAYTGGAGVGDTPRQTQKGRAGSDPTPVTGVLACPSTTRSPTWASPRPAVTRSASPSTRCPA